MDPLTIGAIGAAGISGISSLFGGASADRRRRREAQKQRDWAQMMRSTAYQDTVQDMIAAGLNPALAYQQGPSGSPGGGIATQEDYISPAVSSALQTKRLEADISNIRKQNQKLVQETATSKATESFVKQQRELMFAQTEEAQLKLAAYGMLPPETREVTIKGKKMRIPHITNERDPSLIRERLEADIRQINALTRQRGLTSDVIAPLAELMDAMGIWGPIAAGAGKVLGPSIGRRFQIPKFTGRKLNWPWWKRLTLRKEFR